MAVNTAVSERQTMKVFLLAVSVCQKGRKGYHTYELNYGPNHVEQREAYGISVRLAVGHEVEGFEQRAPPTATACGSHQSDVVDEGVEGALVDIRLEIKSSWQSPTWQA